MTPTPPVIPEPVEFNIPADFEPVLPKLPEYPAVFDPNRFGVAWSEGQMLEFGKRCWFAGAMDAKLAIAHRAPSAKGAPSCDARELLAEFDMMWDQLIEVATSKETYFADMIVLGGRRKLFKEKIAALAAMAVSPSPDSANASSVDSSQALRTGAAGAPSETER
jgi:hypothetical protein